MSAGKGLGPGVSLGPRKSRRAPAGDVQGSPLSMLGYGVPAREERVDGDRTQLN